MAVVSFHFHGYQPGDVVRWLEPDPLKPLRFEERNSPVAHTVGGTKVRGRNWTDAVLHAYGRIETVLEDVGGSASVDIEPQTLAWLLEKDGDAYRRVLAAWARGTAGLAITPPFHPILPHLHALERRSLFEMMVDFYAPLLRRQPGRPIGLWLPEAAVSGEVLQDFLGVARAAASRQDIPALSNRVHLILDRRQLGGHARGSTAWHRLAVAGGLPVVVRDPALSNGFAFGGSSAEEFASQATAGHSESLAVASDLESLLANPTQADRFEDIVGALGNAGISVRAPSPPTGIADQADLVEFSSWSDHDEHLHDGHTSDTRWTGLRRTDGAVISRTHRGEKMSQLWKHAFALATEQVERSIRRVARDILHEFELERRREILVRLAVAYGRHVFRDHYRACGLSNADVDFAANAERIVGGRVDLEIVAPLARAYVTMLMGLRSDPRFWDNPDTRVTFQNVICMVSALVDASNAWNHRGDRERAARHVRLIETIFLEFPDTYGRAALDSLPGVEGWETTEAAWLRSLQSEVPAKSGYEVFRRAALLAMDGATLARVDVPFRVEQVVADTGHIVGEAHGDWENREWCEHRT